MCGCVCVGVGPCCLSCGLRLLWVCACAGCVRVSVYLRVLLAGYVWVCVGAGRDCPHAVS
jgi:hypothetical protein